MDADSSQVSGEMLVGAFDSHKITEVNCKSPTKDGVELLLDTDGIALDSPPKRCISMLEMSEIAEIRDFEDSMRALSADESQHNNISVKARNIEEHNGFFFFDDEVPDAESNVSEVDYVDTNYSGSSQADGDALLMPPTTLGMKRCQSLVAVASSPLRRDPLSSAIHPIQEETSEATSDEAHGTIPIDKDNGFHDSKPTQDITKTKMDCTNDPTPSSRPPLTCRTSVSAIIHSSQPKKSALKRATSMGHLETTGLASRNDNPEERATPAPKMKRNVSFSNVEFREYNVTLGDNPCCSSGPPVSLGWEYKTEHKVMHLDRYETERQPRRDHRQLLLSYNVRRYMLLRESGFTAQELHDAAAAAKVIQKQRSKTIKRGVAGYKVDAALESAGRKMKRVMKKI